MPLSEAAEAFTGVALELWPSPRFERRSPQPPVRLRELVGKVSGLAGSFAQILLVAVGARDVRRRASLVPAVGRRSRARHGQRGAPDAARARLRLLVLCEQATAALRSWIVMHFETTLSLQWHANVFAHLLRLPVPYFEKRHLGDVVSRFRSIDAIQRTVTTASIEAVVDGGMSVVLLIVMCCYSPPLTRAVPRGRGALCGGALARSCAAARGAARADRRSREAGQPLHRDGARHPRDQAVSARRASAEPRGSRCSSSRSTPACARRSSESRCAARTACCSGSRTCSSCTWARLSCSTADSRRACCSRSWRTSGSSRCASAR